MKSVHWVHPFAVLAAVALGAGCASEATDAPAPRADATSPATGGPVAYEDHWHAAVGFYVCDGFLPDLATFESAIGIHTHGDGVIHIHPYTEAGEGPNATLGAFLDEAGGSLEDGELEIEGETFADGDDCPDGPGRVQVARWDDAGAGGEPEIVTEDAADLRFDAPGEGYTIAFVPEGTEVPAPPTADDLDQYDTPDAPADPDGTSPPDVGSGTGDESPEAGAGADGTAGFRPVLLGPVPPEADGRCTAGLLGGSGGDCYEVAAEGGVGLDAVAEAEARLDVGQWTVALVLTDDGIDRFNELAAACYRGDITCPTAQVAIVVGGEVVSAPTISEPAFEPDAISISGDFTEDEAEALAATVLVD